MIAAENTFFRFSIAVSRTVMQIVQVSANDVTERVQNAAHGNRRSDDNYGCRNCGRNAREGQAIITPRARTRSALLGLAADCIYRNADRDSDESRGAVAT